MVSSGFISSIDLKLRREIAVTGMTSGVVQATVDSGFWEVKVFEKFGAKSQAFTRSITGSITISFTVNLLKHWVVLANRSYKQVILLFFV